MTKKQAKKAVKKAVKKKSVRLILPAAFRPGLHVVMVGHVLVGFKFYGPFPDGMAASDWAVENITSAEWFAVPVYNRELLR